MEEDIIKKNIKEVAVLGAIEIEVIEIEEIEIKIAGLQKIKCMLKNLKNLIKMRN